MAAFRIIFPPWHHLEKELPEGSYTAVELFREFTSGPVAAGMHLTGKAVLLEDTISATGKGYICLGTDMTRIRCVFRNTIYDRKPDPKPGERVTVKGICRGQYLTEILISPCIVVNKK